MDHTCSGVGPMSQYIFASIFLAQNDSKRMRSNGKVPFTHFSSLAASEIVEMATSGAESEVKSSTRLLPLPFRCYWISFLSPQWAVVMGIEHERIHLETSSVLIRQLPVDMVTVPEGWVHGPTMHGMPFTDIFHFLISSVMHWNDSLIPLVTKGKTKRITHAPHGFKCVRCI